MNIYKKISKICNWEKNQDLKQYCSIKIGGSADYICFPKSVRQVKKLVCFLTKLKIKYFIIGNGTNLIFSSKGYNGVIICLKILNRILIKDNTLTCYAGASLFYVNQICEKIGLSGLEFSYGIPGTVGGATVMNCGAFNGEMKDVIKSVLVLKGNKISYLKKEQINFSYRKTSLLNNGYVVLKATFKLKKEQSEIIKQRQQEILSKRINSQPYGTLNAGSVFKRKNGESAGKYIDKLGLKGVKIGDVEISTKHANFFINKNNATSDDVANAVSFVKEKVKNEFNLSLEEEIIFVGE